MTCIVLCMGHPASQRSCGTESFLALLIDHCVTHLLTIKSLLIATAHSSAFGDQLHSHLLHLANHQRWGIQYQLYQINLQLTKGKRQIILFQHQLENKMWEFTRLFMTKNVEGARWAQRKKSNQDLFWNVVHVKFAYVSTTKEIVLASTTCNVLQSETLIKPWKHFFFLETSFSCKYADVFCEKKKSSSVKCISFNLSYTACRDIHVPHSFP